MINKSDYFKAKLYQTIWPNPQIQEELKSQLTLPFPERMSLKYIFNVFQIFFLWRDSIYISGGVLLATSVKTYRLLFSGKWHEVWIDI